jgi:hypothetical protein
MSVRKSVPPRVVALFALDAVLDPAVDPVPAVPVVAGVAPAAGNAELMVLMVMADS